MIEESRQARTARSPTCWPSVAGRARAHGLEHREALIYTLGKAAELEHLIMLQYLFAAFSLKQNVSEGLSAEALVAVQRWRKTLLSIGGQEMLHLALVQNLLTAVGAARASPARTSRCRPTATRRGSGSNCCPSVKPRSAISPSSSGPRGWTSRMPKGSRRSDQAVALPHDESDEIVPHLQEFDTIGQLYRSIQAGLEHLADRLGTERLFIGPADAQATEEHFRWEELVAVTDLASATARDRHDRRTGRGRPGANGVTPTSVACWASSTNTSRSRRTIPASNPPVPSWRPTSGSRRPASSCPSSPTPERHAAWTS